MSKILPLRDIKGPERLTVCEFCDDEITPGRGYPIYSDQKIDGYVCTRCFELIGEAEQEPYSIN